MKSVKKILAMCLAIMMIVSCVPAAHAADVSNTAIDLDAKGSLTLYKYDLTNAEKDGVWDSSYVSTGVYDENVNKTLGESKRAGDSDNSSDLGNGEVSYGYAVKGVEFTYLRVGDIIQYTGSANDGAADNHIEILYGIDKAVGADLLTALGLENGADRYPNADHLDNAKYYYQSDVLIDALAQALQNNSTTVKNALETYVANNGGTAMPLTDAYGKSQANNLDLGLYIIAETKCPEMVTSTCAPFFLSIPMSPVSGSNATDGNTRWLYDVTIYPKNLTGIPTLTKSLRENVNDTGKHKGTTNDITDGYASTGTASDGDVIDYQILSTLASITSKSTYFSELAFIDTLSPGLSYNKNDILYFDQNVSFFLFCLLIINYLSRLNIPCRPPRTDPLYRSSFNHGTEHGLNSCGTDIGENLANFGFRNWSKVIQNSRFHTSLLRDLLTVYHCKPLVQFLIAHIERGQEILNK